MSALEVAVGQLYAATRGLPRPVRVSGCTHCCISEAELTRLVQVPREALSPDDLRAYALNAPDTVGAEADFRYFLPRLLDLAAANAFGWPEPGQVVRRLGFVSWRSAWSPPERAAIRVYLRAWWQRALTGPADPTALAETLSTLAVVQDRDGLLEALNGWLAAGPAALLALAQFVLAHATQLALGRGWDAQASQVSAHTVWDWLRAGPPARALERSGDQAAVGGDALLFFEAAALLETP